MDDVKENLELSVNTLEKELSGNVTAIKETVTKQFNDVYQDMEDDYCEIQEELTTVQNNMSLLHVSPIGSICFNLVFKMP